MQRAQYRTCFIPFWCEINEPQSQPFDRATAHSEIKSLRKNESGRSGLDKDDEFEIIDYSEKLRDEDFCFICQTKEGIVFEAKPVGSREIKAEYLANMDDIIGRKGTVKYFELSKEGVPLQPVFQAVRYDLD